jgi:DNA-binding Lrp family transcriptional regulator
MDEIDRQIVALLQQDARSTFRAIGGEVGLSAPAVKRRVDRLVDDGVVTGFRAVLSPAAQGWTTTAFVELFAEPRTPPERIRTGLTKHPEVVGAWTVTGGSDALVQVRVAGTSHLEQVLERIRREPFVTQTRSTVVLTTLVDRDPQAT